jgi:hypothetical protein
MSETPIALLQKAAGLGLKLGARPGDRLTVQPAERCPRQFAETLRQNKSPLLHLLRLPFAMAHSESLGQTIFFCEDEKTKAALVNAGADEWSIYTKDELRVLVAQNRARPFIPDELLDLHKVKRTFNGRIAK